MEGRAAEASRRQLPELVRGLGASVVAAVAGAFSTPPAPRGRRARAVGLIADALLAVVLVSTTASMLADRNQWMQDVGQPDVGSLVVLAAAFALGVPALLRHRAPVTAWRLTVGISLLTAGVFSPILPWPLLPSHLVLVVVTSATAVLRADRPIAFGAWLTTMAATAAVTGAAGSTVMEAGGFVTLVLLLTAPIVFGHNVRARRTAQATLRDQQRRVEQARAGQAVLEERARIARELHDVVAHHMTLVAIQAEAAPLRHPGDATALAGELAAIRATALTALTETRRILGVLRSEGHASAPAPPAPGLGEITALLEAARAAGHPVVAHVEVRDDEVSPGLALSIHRLVQESVSNVLRHAPLAPIDVVVRRHPGHGIEVSVVNGPAPGGAPAASDRVEGEGLDADDGAGHGQIGMRERVAMLDGALELGWLPDGGYAVRALLPEGRG